jgi:hypothetical protein
LPSYYIDEIRVMADGTTKMIGEKRQVITNTVCTQYGCTTYYTYYYEDIIVVQIDPSGNIEWAKRIAKRQITTNDNAVLSSYALLNRENETILLFNDNGANALYNGVGKVAAMQKGSENVAMLVRIDDEGNIQRKGLVKQGEVDVRIRPALSQQLNDTELLVFGHQGLKNQRFILIKVK